MKKEYKEIITGGIAVIMIAVSCFVSYEKFGTFNPIKAGIGFAKVRIFDEDYAEVSDSPRVILTSPENSMELFTQIIESEGYEYVEQMGSAHFIEKDGEREIVNSNINKYIGRWSWQK
ncbi:MAG: hypothetical protein IJB16_03000 [Clostridia bacterium]|nr:hypothetical protein [Clostridia bacterium]